jgi:hypothetical protein
MAELMRQVRESLLEISERRRHCRGQHGCGSTLRMQVGHSGQRTVSLHDVTPAPTMHMQVNEAWQNDWRVLATSSGFIDCFADNPNQPATVIPAYLALNESLWGQDVPPECPHLSRLISTTKS